MADDDLLIAEHDGVVRIALNRPAALNALTRGMFERLHASFTDLAQRSDVRVLCITGIGRAFCTGADLKDPMMGGELAVSERGRNCQAVLGGIMNDTINALHDLPVPTLAIVNGIAAGGGAGLALAADIVIAAQSASFILPFTPRLALVPDLGVTWQLARRIGRARALATVLLGEPISAAQAAEWGLIWRCVGDDALVHDAAAIVQRLRDGPRHAQRAATRLIDAAWDNSLAQQLQAECLAQSELTVSDDAIEALQAFAAKRPPRFS